MPKKPETIAWIVLILSFLTCLLLAVGTPVSIRWYILNATRPLSVALQPNSGTIVYQPKGSGNPVLVTEALTNSDLPLHSRIKLAADAEALLLFYPSGDTQAPVSTVQLYGETELVFLNASTPRFPNSPLPHQITLQATQGRIRLSVGGDERPTTLHFQTPQGAVDLDEGAYTLIIGSERTEVLVSTGRARIPNPASGETFVLTDLQRIELTSQGLGEIAVGGRNLLRNGNLEQPLDTPWTTYTKDIQFIDENGGTIRQTGQERKIVILERYGRGHAETGLEQTVNQDIRGAQSLKVTARLRVDVQDLPLCGTLGTECPLMIRMTYTDQQGGTHEWLQGFYAMEGNTPYTAICIQCEGNPVHIKIPQGAWYAYESPDLLPLLKERGIVPAAIRTVTIYGSGHTYVASIDEIAVLVTE